jgi:hypothetical protein
LWTALGEVFFPFLSFPFLLKFELTGFEEDSWQGQINSNKICKLCWLYI